MGLWILPVEVEATQKSSLAEQVGISQQWELALALAITTVLSLYLFSLA